MGEWISVKDMLPNAYVNVLCLVIEPDGNGGFNKKFKILSRDNDLTLPGWVLNDFYDSDCDGESKVGLCNFIVTHWISICEPPTLKI